VIADPAIIGFLPAIVIDLVISFLFLYSLPQSDCSAHLAAPKFWSAYLPRLCLISFFPHTLSIARIDRVFSVPFSSKWIRIVHVPFL
jgi:hypothetical protein